MYGEFFSDFASWIVGRDSEQRARAQVVFNIFAIFVLGMVTSAAMTWGQGFLWSQIYIVIILIFVNLGLWFTVLTEHFKDLIPENLHAALGLMDDGKSNNSSTPKILRHMFDAVAIYFAYDLYVRIFEWIEFKDLAYSSRVLILIATSLTVVCTGACIYLSFFLQNNGDKNLLGWFVGKNVKLFGTEDKSLIEGFVLLFFGLAVFTAMVPCICAIGLISTGLFVGVVLCLLAPLTVWENSWLVRIAFLGIGIGCAFPLTSQGIANSEINVSHIDQLEDLKVKIREDTKQ